MIYENLAVFLVSFVVCFIVTRFLMERFRERGVVARDMYKEGKPEIPDMGGLAILFGVLAGLIITQLLLPDVRNLLVFYFVVIVYAVFTLTDDLIDVGRKAKIVIPFFLALPIALLNVDTTLSFYFFQVEVGALFPYVIAPLYVMVVANLVNMHSGFNGMQSGISSILLATIALNVVMENGGQNLYYLLPIFGSLLAFFWFNKYPSRIFEGNIGSFLVGSAVGGLLILYNMEFFGVIILIPHIANFFLSRYSRFFKELDHDHIFAKVKGDGTIEPPDYYTLKWLPSYRFDLTEKQSVLLMYALTIVFCVIGLVFF